MTTGGWITMVLSVGFVATLFVWCILRVLRGPSSAKGMAHVEPLDEDEADER